MNHDTELLPPESHGLVLWAFGLFCFIWYVFIVVLSVVGALVVYFKNTKVSSIDSKDESTEGVTILRPLKGVDCEMEACLSSALEQQYPKFEIVFCIESETDAAVGVIQDLLALYPNVDATVMISGEKYGPNPKINNLAKGFAAAKYDIVWVLDSNVWVSPGTMARSVAKFKEGPNIQLVHHLPLCVSIDGSSWGSKLDEMFMLTSHSKFYTAINFVGAAPCVMGKSNLYRRSALDKAVAAKLGKKTIEKGTGIQNFAQYIAEDNMIAQCIWNNGGRTAMTSDSAVQPLGHVSLSGYWSRRVRWLRVRRYMVWVATMIEPTTESILCAIYGTFAVSVLFLGGLRYWSFTWFLIHMVSWCAIDYWHYHNLIKFGNIENTKARPSFVQKYFNPHGDAKRSLKVWLPTWITREILAMPIWLAAMSGHTIYWRHRPFLIRHDLSAKEICE